MKAVDSGQWAEGSELSTEQLPIGWHGISIGDVVGIHNGYAFKTKDFRKSGIPLVKQTNLVGDTVSLDDCQYLDRNFLKEKESFILNKGDILIGMSGSLGKVSVYRYDFPALQNQRTGKLKFYSFDNLSKNLFLYYFTNIAYILEKSGKGCGVQNISGGEIESLPFPLPPLNEQKRIVAKLDAIMPRIAAVNARLDKVPGILKRFRQSVLTAAVTGKLTGSEGYTISAFGDLIVSIRGGTTTPPRKELSDYPVLRSSSVRQGFIDYNDVFYLTKDQSTRQANFIKNGDVLFTRLNGSVEFVGNCAVVKGVRDNYIQYPDRLYCAKLTADILPEYCEIAFADPFLRLEIENRAKSSAGHKRISISDVKEMAIPLPPLEEQKEIVRQVEKLFALADKVESHYQKAKARVDKLSQSVLAKAFRGELVPQDPNDLPAAELLKQILAEKDKMAAQLKKRKTKNVKQRK